MKKKDISEFFNRLRMSNPNPTTELVYSNHFELLVSVVLSAQATDISVNIATSKLYKIANTPMDIILLGEKKLKDNIKNIGLYNSKASNIIALSKILIDKHNGYIPCKRNLLEELPGVGRKTANVVLNTLFGEPTIAVDTHIFRLSNRTGLAPGKTPIEVEKGLIKRIPDEYKINAHHWLILHGRYVCKARKPKCEECIVNNLCGFKQKNI